MERNTTCKRALACLPLLLAAQAHAAWVFDPALELSTGYDDNVRLEADDEESALVSRVAAQAQMRNVTEISEFSAILGGTYIDFSQTDDENLDNEDAEFLRLAGHRNTQRATFGIDASARRDLVLQRLSDIPDLIGGGDGGDEPLPDDPAEDPLNDDIDANATREQVQRVRLFISPYAEYQLTELTGTRLTYIYGERRFDDEGEEAGLRDSDSHSVRGSLFRQFTPRTAWDVTAGASRIEIDGAGGFSREADNYILTVGFDRELSEQSRLTVDVGASQTDDEGADSTDTSLTFSARYMRRMPISRFVAQIERSAEPSAFGDIVDADRVTLNYQRSLSPRWELGFRVYGYRTERLDGEGDQNDRDYVDVRPRLTWRMTNDWNVGVGYRYRWIDRGGDGTLPGTAGGTADSNMVSLFVSYQPTSRL